ncbi:hypothetical protein [Curtobacterium poinsettiae]|uniref:Uncharacterized protein n=1 Tax=Curtobacterium poinsettiae TaxID=159612 RepID=A0ABT3S0X0_9MICO|nr:hypothetical protein [Curtobacterium flaccumfaciens]MBT1610302.1 hypothetical protein [Curtobacterium flaccumfaciens pv. poinsettiae]MBT1620130.1 hypothetical protein [Curtobacterium flaccumfaciens pv. poinsettiae]MCX2848485.1 hypothetical protein [Curtobacterium flaccumfaciens pv. poinsettiae]UXN19073.1 hypothetical protein N8D78_02870 [Curtobacterium flaccumfaciens pv. poinsettiae]
MGARARTRSAGALATALIVVLTLAACTWSPPPPTGSESALAKLITRIERLPGVDTAEGEVRQVDAKDDPHNWITSLEVRADTTDLAVAERIRNTAARGVTGTTLSVTVDVPRGRASAPVAVDPMDPDVVELAGRLRAEPFVRRLWLTPSNATIRLVPGISFSDAVAQARPIVDDHPASLIRGDVSVGITATHPGRALLRTIDGFDRDGDHDVEGLYYSPGTTYADAAQAPADEYGAAAEPERPSLSIDGERLGAVADVLVRTKDEAADAHRAPRTAFSVGLDGTSGWLGLPLDAKKPQDATAPGTPTSGPSPTPWVAADVSDRAATLRAFLERSADAAGVPATVTTGTEQCAPPGSSWSPDATGTRATAFSIVPVFQIVDDAQAPFDAVTALWTSEGFEVSGRAMGRDYWSSSTDADPATASIRGTVDGLSLRAESVCVPRP